MLITSQNFLQKENEFAKGAASLFLLLKTVILYSTSEQNYADINNGYVIKIKNLKAKALHKMPAMFQE